MIARCRSRQIETDASTSGSAGIGFALLIFFVAAGGVSYFAFAPPATHRNAPANGAHTGNAAVPANPGLSAASLQKPVSDKGMRVIPPPISALKPKLGVEKRQDVHQNVRAIPTAEHTQYSGRPDGPARSASQTGRDEGGFVTKVLQPDGSLMEEYFPAKAPR
jgi:hypothetical protein